MLNQCVLDFENVDLWNEEAEEKFLKQRRIQLSNSYYGDDYVDEDIDTVNFIYINKLLCCCCCCSHNTPVVWD